MINKLKLYTFPEIFQLMRYSIGERLILSVPYGLRSTHRYIGSYPSKGVHIFKKDNRLLLEYSLNGIFLKTLVDKNSSDVLAFEQIIIRNEYQPILNVFKTHNLDCSTMIDAGANIGLASIYFKAFFPSVSIIALEPSSSSFDRLKNNLELNDFANVTALNTGLWGNNTFLKPDNTFRGGLDWSFRLTETNEKDEHTIEVISMNELVKKNHIKSIDLLKMDIEGGEVSVFSEDTDMSWLNMVKVLALEIHDEFDCREDIENLLVREGFDLSHSGELTIGVNKKLIG